jgi:hypothetical protein
MRATWPAHLILLDGIILIVFGEFLIMLFSPLSCHFGPNIFLSTLFLNTLSLSLPPISLSWRQVPWDSRQALFLLKLNTCSHRPYVISSVTRGCVCRLQFLLVLASAGILMSGSLGPHDHFLFSQIRDSSNLEGQVFVFISPSNRVARLYLQALGSLFVASYDSQGYGTDRTENTILLLLRALPSNGAVYRITT